MPPESVNTHCTLSRDAYGRLILTRAGAPDTPVVPVRSFPISAPADGIALISPQGREMAWITHLQDLPASSYRLITEELAQREFNPEILRIRQASTWTTPSRWEVDTDRGATQLMLKTEDDIRHLSASTLLIGDACGIHFLIRDIRALDKGSRRILDHFL